MSLSIPTIRLRDSPIKPERKPFSVQPLLEKIFNAEACRICSYDCCFGVIVISKDDPNLSVYLPKLSAIARLLGDEFGYFNATPSCPLRGENGCSIQSSKPWRCSVFPISEYRMEQYTMLYLRGDVCPMVGQLRESGVSFVYLEEVLNLPVVGPAISTLLNQRGSVFSEKWAFHNTEFGPILPVSAPWKR